MAVAGVQRFPPPPLQIPPQATGEADGISGRISSDVVMAALLALSLSAAAAVKEEVQALRDTRLDMCRAIVGEMHTEIHKHTLRKNGEVRRSAVGPLAGAGACVLTASTFAHRMTYTTPFRPSASRSCRTTPSERLLRPPRRGRSRSG